MPIFYLYQKIILFLVKNLNFDPLLLLQMENTKFMLNVFRFKDK